MMRKNLNQKLNMEPKIILKDLGESKLSMLLVQNWLRIRLKTSVKSFEGIKLKMNSLDGKIEQQFRFVICRMEESILGRLINNNRTA